MPSCCRSRPLRISSLQQVTLPLSKHMALEALRLSTWRAPAPDYEKDRIRLEVLSPADASSRAAVAASAAAAAVAVTKVRDPWIRVVCLVSCDPVEFRLLRLLNLTPPGRRLRHEQLPRPHSAPRRERGKNGWKPLSSRRRAADAWTGVFHCIACQGSVLTRLLLQSRRQRLTMWLLPSRRVSKKDRVTALASGEGQALEAPAARSTTAANGGKADDWQLPRLDGQPDVAMSSLDQLALQVGLVQV